MREHRCQWLQLGSVSDLLLHGLGDDLVAHFGGAPVELPQLPPASLLESRAPVQTDKYLAAGIDNGSVIPCSSVGHGRVGGCCLGLVLLWETPEAQLAIRIPPDTSHSFLDSNTDAEHVSDS